MNWDVDEAFHFAKALEKYDRLLANKFFEKMKVNFPDGSGAISRNMLRNKKELEKSFDKELYKDNNFVLIVLPHFLRSALSSHKFFYLAWIERVFKAFPDKLIKIWVSHEAGPSDQDFTVSFFKNNLSSYLFNKIDFHFFPRYIRSEFEFKAYSNRLLCSRPMFAIFFETIETFDKNYVAKFVSNKKIKSIGIHCNPQLPENQLFLISYVTSKAGIEKGDKCVFLPVRINVSYPEDGLVVEKSGKSVVVTAFTNKRIKKILSSNQELSQSILEFVDSRDIEWHFIGHEKIDDYVEVSLSFKRLIDAGKIKVVPIVKDLPNYLSQCDVFAYLPGFYGGNAGVQSAVEVGLPIAACKDKDGEFIRYATEHYAVDSICEFFFFLDDLLNDDAFKDKVSDFQSTEMEMTFNESCVCDIFRTQVVECL